VTDWFPQRERALAIGLFNAGANVGAIITPLLVPVLVLSFGWRAAFFLTGIFGVAWLIAWWTIYRHPAEHKRVGKAELAWIQHDPADPVEKIAWTQPARPPRDLGLRARQVLIDPIWWFFLFWLPGYLCERYDLNLTTFGLPLAAIYLISDARQRARRWMSSRLIKAGYSRTSRARRRWRSGPSASFPVWFAQDIASVWGAVLVIGLATAAHQAFSANLYTLRPTSSRAPRSDR
jgi:ACS family hexuronate transporter-like MFS transporter